MIRFEFLEPINYVVHYCLIAEDKCGFDTWLRSILIWDDYLKVDRRVVIESNLGKSRSFKIKTNVVYNVWMAAISPPSYKPTAPFITVTVCWSVKMLISYDTGEINHCNDLRWNISILYMKCSDQYDIDLRIWDSCFMTRENHRSVVGLKSIELANEPLITPTKKFPSCIRRNKI